MTIEEWLAAYDALDPERKEVEEAMESAEESGNYGDADSERFDLWEKEAALADSAAELLRELHKNSTFPEKWWLHLDGSICDDEEVSQELPGVGICEHDRRVNLFYSKDGRPARP